MKPQCLKNNILQIMTTVGGSDHPSLAAVLRMAACLYGGAVHARLFSYAAGLLRQKSVNRPVLSVGNITAGGTGKTPFVIYLARQAQQWGYRPVIISRGYKGSKGAKTVVVSDGATLLADARYAGDEPVLMAGCLPGVAVVVGHDRHKAAKAAIDAFQPDLIFLDDGFQHLRLHRDVNFLLMDALHPMGNGYLLPRGVLREPASGLGRSSAIILTRGEALSDHHYHAFRARVFPRPVFRTVHQPVVRAVLHKGQVCRPLRHDPYGPELADMPAVKRVWAFSGLARNDTFKSSIRSLGLYCAGHMAFGDHHAYTPKDVSDITAAALNAGVSALITTDKDYVRFRRETRWPLPLIVAGVRIDFRDETRLWENYMAAVLQKQVSRFQNGIADASRPP